MRIKLTQEEKEKLDRWFEEMTASGILYVKCWLFLSLPVAILAP